MQYGSVQADARRRWDVLDLSLAREVRAAKSPSGGDGGKI
jgi:hypothetical protein